MYFGSLLQPGNMRVRCHAREFLFAKNLCICCFLVCWQWSNLIWCWHLILSQHGLWLMLSFPHAAARAGIAYLDLVGKREWYGLLQIAWYQVATGVCKCLCGISTWCRWAHCFVELCARSDFTISRFSIWMQIYCIIYSSFANAFPKLRPTYLHFGIIFS